MRRILIAVESIDDAAFELACAARSLGEVSVTAVVGGTDLSGAGTTLSAWCEEVVLVEDERLSPFDGDLFAAALLPWIEKERPYATLVSHTNNGMDFAPLLAARAGLPLLADCLALEARDDRLAAVRAVYGGKIHARVAAAPSPQGYVATVRPGAYALPPAPPATGGTVRTMSLPDGVAPRRRFVETVAPEAGAVDITQSELLVAVGRGIDDEENLEMIRSLAEALGAEVACTRPVVDKGWMEKSRQVGTSGVTVKPKVYLAVGVSGSFQHMGGVKGGPFIAAINKDPAAPIFGVADVGIVGDLFDLVPLLEEKIREKKG